MQRRIAIWLARTGLLCLVAGLLLPVVGAAQDMAHRAMSGGNLKCLGVAARLYAEEHTGRFPTSAEKPAVALRPHLTNVGEDPWAIPGQPGATYRTNPALSGKKTNAIYDAYKVVLFYEPFERSGGKGRYVAYADGHAQFVPSLNWPEVARKSGFMPPPDLPFIEPWPSRVGGPLALFGLEALIFGGILYGAVWLGRKRA